MFTAFSLILWISWYSLWEVNRRSQPEQERSPFYYTASFGDAIGLSLVTLAFDLQRATFPTDNLLVALLIALTITTTLHIYWSRNATWQVGSLYTTDYKGVPAAWVHNFYVLYTAYIGTLFCIAYFIHDTTYTAWIFLAGIIVYTITMAIDHKRGLI